MSCCCGVVRRHTRHEDFKFCCFVFVRTIQMWSFDISRGIGSTLILPECAQGCGCPIKLLFQKRLRRMFTLGSGGDGSYVLLLFSRLCLLGLRQGCHGAVTPSPVSFFRLSLSPRALARYGYGHRRTLHTGVPKPGVVLPLHRHTRPQHDEDVRRTVEPSDGPPLSQTL